MVSLLNLASYLDIISLGEPTLHGSLHSTDQIGFSPLMDTLTKLMAMSLKLVKVVGLEPTHSSFQMK